MLGVTKMRWIILSLLVVNEDPDERLRQAVESPES